MSLTQAYTVLFNSSDVELGTSTNPMRVDPTGTTTQPVSGTVTANQGTPALAANAWFVKLTDGTNSPVITNTTPGASDYALVVRQIGTVSTSPARPATSTVTSTAPSTTVSTILASNAARLGALFYCPTGSNMVFIKLGTGATTSVYTIRLSANSEWELPDPVFTGAVTAITQSGTGTILVTELTP